MFNFLKSSKMALTVAVDRDSRIYYPDETIRATVILESSGELKIRAGHIALICQEDYKYCSEQTDSDGERTTSTNWGQTRRMVEKTDFLGETVFPANTHQTYDFTFPIPATAPPTGSGSIFRLKWLVEANLDRKLAADVKGEAEVVILSMAPGRLVMSGEYSESNESHEAVLAFSLPGQEWGKGQTVIGEFRILPQKEFDVSEVRLELVRHEYVPYDEGNIAENVALKVKLADKTKLRAGELQSFPFQVVIPTDALPSITGEMGTIAWRLRGILARKLRSDTRIDQEIMIYTGRSG